MNRPDDRVDRLGVFRVRLRPREGPAGGRLDLLPDLLLHGFALGVGPGPFPSLLDRRYACSCSRFRSANVRGPSSAQPDTANPKTAVNSQARPGRTVQVHGPSAQRPSGRMTIVGERSYPMRSRVGHMQSHAAAKGPTALVRGGRGPPAAGPRAGTDRAECRGGRADPIQDGCISQVGQTSAGPSPGMPGGAKGRLGCVRASRTCPPGKGWRTGAEHRGHVGSRSGGTGGLIRSDVAVGPARCR